MRCSNENLGNKNQNDTLSLENSESNKQEVKLVDKLRRSSRIKKPVKRYIAEY